MTLCQAYVFEKLPESGGPYYARTRCQRKPTEITDNGLVLCLQHYKSWVDREQKDKASALYCVEIEDEPRFLED